MRDPVDFAHARNGQRYINSADGAVTGLKAFGMLIVRDTVLTSATPRGNAVTGATKLAAVTLPAGLYLPIPLAGVQVTSGLVAVFAEPV